MLKLSASHLTQHFAKWTVLFPILIFGDMGRRRFGTELANFGNYR